MTDTTFDQEAYRAQLWRDIIATAQGAPLPEATAPPAPQNAFEARLQQKDAELAAAAELEKHRPALIEMLAEQGYPREALAEMSTAELRRDAWDSVMPSADQIEAASLDANIAAVRATEVRPTGTELLNENAEKAAEARRQGSNAWMYGPPEVYVPGISAGAGADDE